MLRKILFVSTVLVGCGAGSFAQAKYCVKLPSCEELGYIFPYKEGRRSIRCPFDTSKVLYLDYCQAYGLSSKPNDAAGAYQECVEEKADGTKINTGYYRYTRCNSGYTYQSGDCVSSRKQYAVGDIYYYNDTPIGVVFYDDGKTTKIVALTDVNASGQASSATGLYWSTSSIKTDYVYYDVDGLTNISGYDGWDAANEDMDGKSNTQKILAYIKSKGYTAQAATATSKYAPSVCANGSICGAGEWYLPAFGELWILHHNESTINSRLGSAGGTAISTSDTYWSSTEYNDMGAWHCGIQETNVGVQTYRGTTNKGDGHYVRPVLAF